jgi:large subunit ribosomal protein L1
MVSKEDFVKAIEEIRKQGVKVKFTQTVDLIVNLKDFDMKKNSLNLVLPIPHKFEDKKIAGFLEKKSTLLDTVTKAEFDDFKDKKKMKKLVRSYDLFIASAKLMPSIATSFGRALGPAGKMPSPQLGVIMQENDNSIKEIMVKINSMIKVKAKEPSVKLAVGKEDNKDSDIAENAFFVYNEILKVLPRGKDNLKSILIKFTMTKPAKIKLQ